MRFLSINQFVYISIIVASLGIAGCQRSTPDSPSASTLSADNAYMLAIAPGQTRAAVYLKLKNVGDQSRSINLISSSIAGYCEVHTHSHENGVMSMRQVMHPKVPAKSTMDFSPGGYHIMLFDVAETPAVGSKVELLLEFDKAETLRVLVDVKPVH